MRKIFALLIAATMFAACYDESDEPENPLLQGTVGLIDNGDGTGTLNGYAWVDLGITITEDGETKRLVIATTNIGAENPEDAGYYFRWGELNGWKTTAEKGGTLTADNTMQMPCILDGSFADYKETWSDWTFSGSISLAEWPLSGRNVDLFGGKAKAGYAKFQPYGDAATYNWGEGWRMPTNTEAQKIKDTKTAGSTTTWTANGQKITIPAAGILQNSTNVDLPGDYLKYWTPNTQDYNFKISADLMDSSTGNRWNGYPIRPVAVIP